MDTALPYKPKTIAELMPGLTGILSKDAMRTLTAKKQPRLTVAPTRTTEKVLKPMTIAELRAELQGALKIQSPRRFAQGATSTKTKWNSSVKVENKIVSHTAGGQMKHNPVRKVLDFQQPNPKIAKTISSKSRMTFNPETPKFQRPEIKPKKSVYQQARNAPRISGICHIAETPLLMDKPAKRITVSSKENVPNQAVKLKKTVATPKSSFHKRMFSSRIPDTPLSNESWKSSCDASFLQNEKDIDFIEDKTKALTEEKTLENIAEVSPPMSTPFKEYRNVKEFFNNSSGVMDNSSAAYHDNTIMSFDKTAVSKENSKREESVIVSLCDMLNKAMVSKPNTEKMSIEFDDLLQIEKQAENNLKMIENGIKTLNSIKESQLMSLQYVRKLIDEKQMERTSESDREKTVVKATKDVTNVQIEATPIKSQTMPKPNAQCSVIKSCLKSPSYKIPKKNMACMRKKVFYKSLPNVSNLVVTPPKDMGDRALSMYMKMKEHMNFLSTPVVKQRPMDIPDTPAITSHNLQLQLDKLYDEN